MGEKLQNDLQVGLANIFMELGNIIRQISPQRKETHFRKKTSEVINVESQEKLQKSMASSSGPESFKTLGNNVSILPGSTTSRVILDLFKINSRRSKLDCPCFDGYDFLGWYMKVEQFFEAIAVVEEEKVQLYLEGNTMQWY